MNKFIKFIIENLKADINARYKT